MFTNLTSVETKSLLLLYCMVRFITMALFALFACSACKSPKMNASVKIHALRLKPGEDLKIALSNFVKEKHIEAGWVVSCAGSLTEYQIRFANQPGNGSGSGHFEIVSLGGTLSVNGSHLHISIADSTGRTIGGHLSEGCRIYTTAEIIIGESTALVFKREKDGTTPWEELQIEEKK